MEFTNGHSDHRDYIIALFKDAFTASEGAAEGDRIANLVTSMLSYSPILGQFST